MSEKVNTNVFNADKKFVDFSGLDYFWSKAKTYIDDVDASMSLKVAANEGEINAIKQELEGLNGGAGSIATQISNAITALDLPNAYEAKGAADAALEDAKEYVDGKVDGKFDAAGSAAQALADAKDYADGLAGNYEVAGAAKTAEQNAKTYADGLNGAMDTRVKVLEAIDHDQLAADAAASAVATVLDGAPESFNTLKEVAAWIGNNEHASDVAGLVSDVENLKKIDHDAYVEADKTVLADAKAYADEKVGALSFDEAGTAEAKAAEALAEAKSYVDGKVDGKFDAAGSASAAETAAKAYADSLAGNYEVAGAAKTAEDNAKAYADGLAGNYDAAGAATAAQAAAIAQAKLDAAEALKAYYTKTEVDNLLATNSEGDRAYAKQYTDELFGSFKFAANSDIDGLFNKA
jgi:hypothetical protein